MNARTKSTRKLRPPDARFFQALYRLGLGPLVGRLILLLTTTGRKSGLPRLTALQYEEVDGEFYLGSSRGAKADWYRNIQANPRVQVQVKGRRLEGSAEPVSDPVRVADFIALRLQRHPRLIGMILKSEGLPEKPSRAELEEYARSITLVIVRPDEFPQER
jgi:deazaflavin-dependent oxidoreductase (nitroreductase family)